MAKNQSHEQTLSDMMNSLPEAELLDPGTHAVRVLKSEIRTSQKGNQYLNLFVTPVEAPNSDPFGGMLMIPGAETPRTRARDWLRDLSNLAEQLGQDPSQVTPQNLEAASKGATIWAKIGVETREPYGTRNKIVGITKPE